MGDFERAVSLSELCKAVKECKRGVRYKTGPSYWYIHRITMTRKLQQDILNGKYKLKPGKVVKIYKPKRREAVAPWFSDRVWQRSMCNNGLYDDLTRGFILDNIACQKGKGQDLAIRRVIVFLQKLYRSDPKANIYGGHYDIRKYFPSTPHKAIKALDEKVVTEKRYISYLSEIVDSVKDARSPEDINADPFGERGTGLGSQINQLHQISLLNGLDHELKCFCKYYIRYNDDFLILDHDKQVIQRAKELIEKRLAELGLTMTDKAGVFIVQRNGVTFLRKRFVLTGTGKIVIRLHKGALTEERHILKHLKEELKAGRIDMHYIKRHYQAWIAQAEYAGDGPIRTMDKFYTVLFRAAPQYKRKKRYLYGRHCQKCKGTPQGH